MVGTKRVNGGAEERVMGTEKGWKWRLEAVEDVVVRADQ